MKTLAIFGSWLIVGIILASVGYTFKLLTMLISSFSIGGLFVVLLMAFLSLCMICWLLDYTKILE